MRESSTLGADISDFFEGMFDSKEKKEKKAAARRKSGTSGGTGGGAGGVGAGGGAGAGGAGSGSGSGLDELVNITVDLPFDRKAMKQFNPTMLEKLDKMDFVKFAITTPDASRLVLHMHVREGYGCV